MDEAKLQIAKLPLKDAYKLFITFMTEDDKSVYNIVRFGENGHLVFDLYDYFKGDMKLKNKKGLILYRGRAYNSKLLYTELERREILLKNYIIKNMSKQISSLPRDLDSINIGDFEIGS